MFKALTEKRASLVDEMNKILVTADTEQRAMTEEESARFDELEAQIKQVDATIESEKRARAMMSPDPEQAETEQRAQEDVETKERKAFEAYLRGMARGETRAESNLVAGSTGAVVPTTIAQKIISKLKDICPVMELADVYNVAGTLEIPYYEETENDTQFINAAYATEFEELTSHSGKMQAIELKGFLAGALAKISKSLITNSQFDVVEFATLKMAEAMAQFIEHEVLIGTANKADGISTKTPINAGSTTAITADNLIDLQEEVPDALQPGAVWVMNRKTRTAIRKLKNEDGDYLLNKDLTAKWGYTLLGHDVYCSDNMPAISANSVPIAYVNFKGVAVKFSEAIEIQVLRERFATQHAVGIVGYTEFDSKIENAQAVARLKMATA